MHLTESVTLCEVGPRDGFQMEAEFIPTHAKVEIIDLLSRTGLTEIQTTSFVHPRAIPQLADAEEVMAGIERVPGVTYAALVPNLRGAERALAAGVDRVDVVVSVSRSHCLANTRMEPRDALAQAGEVAALARAAGVSASVGLATALGCPFEGFPEVERVAAMASEAVETHGFGHVAIADTAGMADPGRVTSVAGALRERVPEVELTLHLHDTRRMGLANVMAGLRAGIRRFDASVAGLGGCPYAPGATGNVATEDVLNLLELMGVDTGVSLDALLSVAARVRDTVGHADSGVLRAGPSRQLVART